MLPHNSHIVQKGETLQSIAEKYHISVEALRRYHNTYCELSDLIEGKLTHHKKIFIPQSPLKILTRMLLQQPKNLFYPTLHIIVGINME